MIQCALPCLSAILLVLLLGDASAGETAMPVFRISDQRTSAIDPRLFGQFLERASAGEPGPEAFADARTGALPAPLVAMMDSMEIPVIRFPGGTDVDFSDWRDMIDGVPERTGGRPVTVREQRQISNRFGYDEYFALRDRLRCETILVVNLFDALLDPAGPQAALERSLGLLAYANAPLDAALPEAVAHWPRVRAANGHAAPFRCEYVQLGNEIGFKIGRLKKATGITDPALLATRLRDTYRAAIALTRRIDPTVRIIIDGELGGLEADVLADAPLREHVYAAAFHRYAPGRLTPIRALADDAPPSAPVQPDALTPQDYWDAMCTMPAQLDRDGQALAVTGPAFRRATRLGYRTVCTEWNWNGWQLEQIPDPERQAWLPMARALGTGSFLHGLLRQGGHITLATQSMLLGHRWQIAAIQADPTGARAPWFSPQGLVTRFYARQHGRRLLDVEAEHVPTRPQGYTMGQWTKWPEGRPRIADLDVIASDDDTTLYLHLLQRSRDQEHLALCDLSALGLTSGTARLRTLRARTASDPRQAEPCVISESALRFADGRLQLSLPPQTLHIIAIPYAAAP